MNTTHQRKGKTVTNTEHPPKTPSPRAGIFALLGAFLCIAGSGASAALPATAGAYATPEGPPIYSSAPGLPDGRVYEQVSPADKNGNVAGATTVPEFTPAEFHWGYAAADGNSVLFEGTGPMGESASPDSFTFVASRNKQCPDSEWCTRSVAPASRKQGGKSPETLAGFDGLRVDPSPDLSHAMLLAKEFTLAPLPNEACHDQLYLAGSNPFVPATWLLRPQIENPVGSCVAVEDDSEDPDGVGGTPDFSTVYFGDLGTLLPADAERAQHVVIGDEAEELPDPRGFYEDREGELREAGVLPDEKLDPFGAVPAASPDEQTVLDGNQVSENGLRAFFVSPDPASCTTAGGQNNCAVDPPELYVRENGERTVLVSQSQLPGRVGEPAPSGPLLMPNAVSYFAFGSYVFASPDGSQAFFQSEDALTKPAEAASPGTEPKTYDFDLETGALTYLPGASGKIEIVATDTDGSSFAFVKPEAGGAPAELELWSGPEGGSVTPVTQLPGATAKVVRMSNDGSVLAFQTYARIPGFNNGGTHRDLQGGLAKPGSEQVYRYDVPANTLGCVSCPPHGVVPSGNASMSTLDYYQQTGDEEATTERAPAARGISANGDRIFFDTPDPLVPQDTNTHDPELPLSENEKEHQNRDVYEWENGVVYLISSGKSTRETLLLDSSANGDDVFFATTEALVPGDTDGGYDVYDARVPQETPTPAAVPCEGSVCQGPPNVPSPLTPPASATFSGLGNPTPEVTPPPPPAKTTTKTVKCKKGFTKKKNKCVKNKKPKKANTKRGAKS
jgi:hypothetical protein